MARMEETQRKQATVASGVVSYLDWAAQGPDLHFAHATGFNSETYRTLLQPLSDSFHVLASDARGHGFTALETRPGLARGWSVFRDDLLAFLHASGDSPVLLAGHSMGAVTSLMAAAELPERVRGLVLIEPVLFAVPLWEQALALVGVHRKNTLATGALRRRETFASRDAVFDAYSGRGIFSTWPDEMLRDYIAGGFQAEADGTVRLACPPWWEAEIYRGAPARLDRLASRIRCPVTLLHGAKSSACPANEAVRFAKRQRRTRRICVPKAGHFLPMEYPELVRDEIRRMVETLDLLEGIRPGAAAEDGALELHAASFILEK
jgi:pimeloyl-ACP methyl ester carboxylesterase